MNTKDISVRRGSFGGHTATIRVAQKIYSVIVVGTSASVVCQYYARPANWRCRSEFISVRRELSDGPTMRAMVSYARAAIAREFPAAGSNEHWELATRTAA